MFMNNVLKFHVIWRWSPGKILVIWPILNGMTLLCVESLLVVASVGVQLTTTFASGRQTAMFYDIADISSIVINEAVTMVSCAMLSQLLSY